MHFYFAILNVTILLRYLTLCHIYTNEILGNNDKTYTHEKLHVFHFASRYILNENKGVGSIDSQFV